MYSQLIKQTWRRVGTGVHVVFNSVLAKPHPLFLRATSNERPGMVVGHSREVGRFSEVVTHARARMPYLLEKTIGVEFCCVKMAKAVPSFVILICFAWFCVYGVNCTLEGK